MLPSSVGDNPSPSKQGKLQASIPHSAVFLYYDILPFRKLPLHLSRVGFPILIHDN